MSVCVKCQKPIERAVPRGRPPSYCSDICRGAAAYELRRVQKRLEAMEVRRGVLRQATETDLEYGIRDALGRDLPQQLAALEAQIAEDEARLRLLLSEPGRGKALEAQP